jgi:transcriptional regulator with XRE-family HTH domain
VFVSSKPVKNRFMEDLMKTAIRYGKRIKEARLLRGWTQEHLAEIADIATRTIARVEKDEVRGQESLMAIAAALETELRDLATFIRIAEAKPLRSLLIRQPDDLHVAFNRAHHSGLYRTLLMPIRDDYRERAEELLETIFSDLQYLSPDESDIVRSWVCAAREPMAELRSMGMEIFTIQDDREGFIGEQGSKKLVERWTTGYYLLVLEHSCFSTGNCVHAFEDQCADGVQMLHDWLRQEQDGTDVKLHAFANVLLASPIGGKALTYCPVCFPKGPTGVSFTEEYLSRITGLSAVQLQELTAELRATGKASSEAVLCS